MTSRFAIPTFTARNLRGRCVCRILRGAFQRDDRQVSCPTVEADLEREPIAGLSGNERTRSRARCAAWLASARLQARPSIRRSQSGMYFVGGPALERCVRAMRVVPGNEVGELPGKGRSTLRNQGSARCLIFHGSDEALDYGDAPVLPDSAIPWANSLAATPAFEAYTAEDAVLVAD
jgi:hypothetical protein